jgi:predicted nucleic acid-binding protein
MRFWDSSAILPLLVLEQQSDYCVESFSQDGNVLVWTMTKIEVFSALCRRLRDRSLRQGSFDVAVHRMQDFFEAVYEIVGIARVKDRALRLLRVHPLRAADSLQLAAALVATEENTGRLPIMCFDERLTTAARLEGFEVNP